MHIDCIELLPVTSRHKKDLHYPSLLINNSFKHVILKQIVLKSIIICIQNKLEKTSHILLPPEFKIFTTILPLLQNVYEK